MKFCQDCASWKRLKNGTGECLLLGGTDDLEIEITVHDDSGLEYTVITKADFGCVLHIPHQAEIKPN